MTNMAKDKWKGIRYGEESLKAACLAASADDSWTTKERLALKQIAGGEYVKHAAYSTGNEVTNARICDVRIVSAWFYKLFKFMVVEDTKGVTIVRIKTRFND